MEGEKLHFPHLVFQLLGNKEEEAVTAFALKNYFNIQLIKTFVWFVFLPLLLQLHVHYIFYKITKNAFGETIRKKEKILTFTSLPDIMIVGSALIMTVAWNATFVDLEK